MRLSSLLASPVARKLFLCRLLRPGFRTCTPDTPPAVERCVKKLAESGDVRGDYLEFGVFQGYTLMTAYESAKACGLGDMRFFGFDSFRGLPQPVGKDAGGKFKEGHYACSKDVVAENLKACGVDMKRVSLVEGFYDDSLNDETRRSTGIKEAAVVLVDCDLYSSSSAVLKFVEGMIRDGTIIIFDDWNCFNKDPDSGERKAFREFLERNKHISAEEFISFGWHGQAFICRVSKKKT